MVDIGTFIIHLPTRLFAYINELYFGNFKVEIKIVNRII